MVRCGEVRCGVAWCGGVGWGLVRCGEVRCGVARCWAEFHPPHLLKELPLGYIHAFRCLLRPAEHLKRILQLGHGIR